MIRDCRDGRPEGWSYFVSHYVPVVRRLLAHYFSDRAGEGALMERVLVKLRDPQSRLFQSLDPAPERLFVAELRQHVRRAVETDRASPAPEMALDVETLGAALESFTLTEKLVVWFETMRYGAQDAGRMLRMSAETADKIRVRASESIRGKLDAWRSSILVDNGLILGQAAAGLATKDCPPAKVFCDVIDGRATWRGREEMERHVKGCFHCLDHYCRLLEASDLLRVAKPLAEDEASQYRRMLGIEAPKRSFWKRS